MKQRHDDTDRPSALAQWSARAVLHVDMDAFFASVEQLDHPEWRGHPVVVGGSPEARGVIAAASYEARRYGVHSAMPSARAARLLPPDAIWARGDFARYREMSQAVFTIFRSFTPDVQGASIDEAYLDVTPGPHREHPVMVAYAIRDAVDAIGLSCSIGVASNKTVAKIASDRDKPHGITVVSPGEEAVFLAPLPAVLMPGIGPTTAQRLGGIGVHTLGELAAMDEVTALHALGSQGPGLVARARGVDTRPVCEREPVKSVSNERTFAADLRDRAEIRDAVGGLAEHVAARLRRAGLAGRTVHVKVRYGDFSTRTGQSTLREATDSDETISATANTLVESLWAPGVGVRLLGVGVSGFDAAPVQLTLQTDEGDLGDDERRRSIERAVDEVRERFGPRSVRIGTRRQVSREPHEPRDRDR